MQRLTLQAAQQYRPEELHRSCEYVQQDALAAAQLRAPLYEDKVVDFLFDKAEISEREVTREEIEAAIEADDDGHVHGPGCGHDRSEEHTSELQSLMRNSYAVFCLKKKTKTHAQSYHNNTT